MEVSPNLSWRKGDSPVFFMFNVSLQSISNWRWLCEVRETFLISHVFRLLSITVAEEAAHKNFALTRNKKFKTSCLEIFGCLERSVSDLSTKINLNYSELCIFPWEEMTSWNCSCLVLSCKVSQGKRQTRNISNWYLNYINTFCIAWVKGHARQAAASLFVNV